MQVRHITSADYRRRLRAIRAENARLKTTVAEQERSEATLRQSEAWFRAMFENSPVGINILDMNRVVLEVNPAMCRMLGYTREELVGKTPAFVTHPGDQPRSTQKYEELRSGQQASNWDERRYRRKNGEEFWAQVTVTLVRDPDGRPLYLIGMAIDVSEPRHILAELRESEARFRAVYENAAIGISLIAPDGQVLAVNPVLARLAGRSESELIALGGRGITYPEDLDIGRQELDEVIAGKRDSYQVDKRYVHIDGRLQWMRQSVSAVRDPDGNLLYLVVMAEDVDERRRAVEKLRESETRLRTIVESLAESEARFRAMFENSAVGMGLMSLERIVFDANPAICAMLGYSREELIGQSPAMVTHPDDFLGSTEQFAELLSGEIDHYNTERRYVRKNGEVFWAHVSMNLVHDPNGKPLYLVGLINNIDAQKRAAERLAAQEADYRLKLEQRIAERTEELNRANELLRAKAAQDAVTAERTRLARDLHDAVTQTLFSTTLIADVLPEIWAMNPDEGRRRLEEVRQLTRGALAEMRTLLVELRPNALVEVPLPTLLRQLTEATIGRGRINVELIVEGSRKLPPDVQVGLYRIAQEALNNVVKHARASHAVVNLRYGGTVRLMVADNGAGFDPACITPDHLGVKIMRERAEAVGAKFSLYSEPGEGTQISVLWE